MAVSDFFMTKKSVMIPNANFFQYGPWWSRSAGQAIVPRSEQATNGERGS